MRRLQERNVVWRYPNKRTIDYAICYPIHLDDGLLITQDGLFYVDNDYTFLHLCSEELPVLYSTNLIMREHGINPLPIFEESWYMYLNHEEIATLTYRYRDSIYPIIYSIATAAVISVFLTAILFTKHYLTSSKPTLLLRFSSLIATCQLVSIYVFTIIKLHTQWQNGESAATVLMDDMSHNLGFNVVYMISFLLLLLTQVQIIQKIFPRRREKKVIIVSGITITIIAQVVWGLSTFLTDNDSSDEDDDASEYDLVAILPGLMYLIRISLSVLYSSLIQVYSFSKRDFIFKSKVLPLTITMIISINSSIAFFVADISNVWVSELSEVFNLACYVVTNIITWEWLSRVNKFEKHKQKQGILGRQFFDEVSNEHTNDYNQPTSETKTKFNLKSKDNYRKLKDKIRLHHRKDKPRRPDLLDHSTSSRSNYNNNSVQDDTDVYIYSPKQVVIEPFISSNRLASKFQHSIPANPKATSTPVAATNTAVSANATSSATFLPSRIRQLKEFSTRRKPVIQHNIKRIRLSPSSSYNTQDLNQNHDGHDQSDNSEIYSTTSHAGFDSSSAVTTPMNPHSKSSRKIKENSPIIYHGLTTEGPKMDSTSVRPTVHGGGTLDGYEDEDDDDDDYDEIVRIGNNDNFEEVNFVYDFESEDDDDVDKDDNDDKIEDEVRKVAWNIPTE
ncbi:hypothetical protein CANARDRAFT_28807 [[Candida] arabinofermentans NRRL YB-2248]|uniref:pH-response regulator protein palH/RIM21 n=1 Tax=[Candida] arabinofermentans NRRL YB-2248 TaxID=983967 RepID=A0A1E4T034_9ASCO|nr:hypothetical protein CANARDRAFT_28807 [[Candida] arabinofermentans NRRL YB-2248]